MPRPLTLLFDGRLAYELCDGGLLIDDSVEVDPKETLRLKWLEFLTFCAHISLLLFGLFVSTLCGLLSLLA